MQERQKFKIVVLSITIFLIGVLIIGILGFLGVFHKNPYGASIKIDNFHKYYREVPVDTYDSVTSSLHKIISSNLHDGQTTPSDGAEIRPDTISNTQNEDALTTTSKFVVDIASIQQSYQIQMVWSNDEDANIGGYSVLINCPTEAQLIYSKFNCKDILDNDPLNALYDKYPIIYQLPINISYYGSNYSGYTNYVISYKADDDYKNIKLIITDYTGGNRENALNEIRKRGYNPSDYTIEYKDESADQAPGRVPESDIMPDI